MLISRSRGEMFDRGRSPLQNIRSLDGNIRLVVLVNINYIILCGNYSEIYHFEYKRYIILRIKYIKLRYIILRYIILNITATIAFKRRPCSILLTFYWQMPHTGNCWFQGIYGGIGWTRNLNFHLRWCCWKTCVNRRRFFCHFMANIYMLKWTPVFCVVENFSKISHIGFMTYIHVYTNRNWSIKKRPLVPFLKRLFTAHENKWIGPYVFLIFLKTKFFVLFDFLDNIRSDIRVDSFALVSDDIQTLSDL